MGAIASEITSLTIVFSTIYLDTDQRKHQSSASLAFVRGIHRRPVNSPHKWPVTRKMFPFDDVIMFVSDFISVETARIPISAACIGKFERQHDPWNEQTWYLWRQQNRQCQLDLSDCLQPTWRVSWSSLISLVTCEACAAYLWLL